MLFQQSLERLPQIYGTANLFLELYLLLMLPVYFAGKQMTTAQFNNKKIWSFQLPLNVHKHIGFIITWFAQSNIIIYSYWLVVYFSPANHDKTEVSI